MNDKERQQKAVIAAREAAIDAGLVLDKVTDATLRCGVEAGWNANAAKHQIELEKIDEITQSIGDTVDRVKDETIELAGRKLELDYENELYRRLLSGVIGLTYFTPRLDIRRDADDDTWEYSTDEGVSYKGGFVTIIDLAKVLFEEVEEIKLPVGTATKFVQSLRSDFPGEGPGRKLFEIKPAVRELLCQRCGMEYPVWCAPNELWNRVHREGEHFFCLTCFAVLAEERGIVPTAWVIDVEDLTPRDIIVICPNCGKQHVDKPEPDVCECVHDISWHTPACNSRNGCPCKEFKVAWNNPPHKSHTCRLDYGGCGKIFRIADFPTNGVAAINTRGKDDTWPEQKEDQPA